MAVPTLDIRVDWDNDGFGSSGIDVITADVLTIAVEQPPVEFGPTVSPTAATFRVKNEDGKYLDLNSSSPLFGKLRPNRKIAAIATWAGTPYGIFSGYVDAIVPVNDADDPVADLICVDPVARWDRRQISIGAGQRTLAELRAAILDELGGIAAGQRDLPLSEWEIIPYSAVENVSAVYALGRVNEANGSRHFVRPGSTFATPFVYTVRDRNYALGTFPHREAVRARTPIAYWRLGEAAGTVAVDDMGTHTGTYLNTPSLGVAGALADDPNTAVTFAAASSEDVTVNDHAALDLGDGPLSIIAWVKPVSVAGANRGIVSKGTNAYYLRLDAAGKVEFLKANAVGGLALSSIPLPDTGWHHAAVTRTAAGAVTKVYIDAVDVTTNPGAAALADTGSLLRIGSLSVGATEAFDGSLDEVAIFGTALSQADVTAIYTSGLSSVLTAGTDFERVEEWPGTAGALINEQLVTAAGYVFGGAVGTVWDYADVASLPLVVPAGQTRTIFANLTAPARNVSLVIATSGGAPTNVFTFFGQSAKIEITAPGSATVVSALSIEGQASIPLNAPALAEDAASQTLYELMAGLPIVSDLIVSETNAQGLADHLVWRFRGPRRRAVMHYENRFPRMFERTMLDVVSVTDPALSLANWRSEVVGRSLTVDVAGERWVARQRIQEAPEQNPVTALFTLGADQLGGPAILAR